jgi:hypothetical protein
MKRKKLICKKCNKLIDSSNFIRHSNSCKGIDKKLRVKEEWKQENGKYLCIFCKKEYTKMGIISHILIKHLGHTIHNNLKKYNEDVKKGKIKSKNQYILAKEQGKKWIMPPEAIEKQRLKHIGKHLSKEHKEILSLKRSKAIEELGRGGFKHIKWYKITNIQNQEFIVRGKWELKVANLLNANNIVWIRKIYLKYEDEKGVLKTYTPDFYLLNYNKYIEVKGYFSVKDKQKIEKVLQKNKINLIIIDKNIINNEDEILKKIIT